jgi:hypothetical protein
MLSLVLAGVPLDVGVAFVDVVAVWDVSKRATDLVPGKVAPGGGIAETSAPSARRLRMLTR